MWWWSYWDKTKCCQAGDHKMIISGFLLLTASPVQQPDQAKMNQLLCPERTSVFNRDNK
jgi:hypothetical protein